MAPTLAQQRAYAFAPIPFAALSFLSSGYVIHCLLCKERRRLERLYHRLVLAMNFALLPLSFVRAWSRFAVPEGTDGYLGAAGTMETCTAHGFLSLMLTMTVPVYYVSLSVQAFAGVANGFKEEKYRWIEKYIHLTALVFPAALCTVVAATENFNPGGSGCGFKKAPHGCEDDPDIPCTRGRDIDVFEYIAGISIPVLYFVIPPFVTASMYCYLKRLQKKVDESRGMQKLREKARKQVIHQVAIQISLYLFSFWFTIAPGLIVFVYHIVTGRTWYNMNIVGNCIFACQGFIMMVVYFALERMGGTPRVEDIPTPAPVRDSDLTVRSIRASARRTSMQGPEESEGVERSLSFNIFDGTPDADSPWARYFDQEDDDSDDSEQINVDEEGGVPNGD